MFELNINGKNYEFNFGMGFLREINKQASVPIDGVKDAQKNVGLQLAVAGVIDGDLETLENVLLIANKGRSERITQEILDAYIENESTNVDALFEDVLSFFKCANSTRKTVESVLTAIQEQEQTNP